MLSSLLFALLLVAPAFMFFKRYLFVLFLLIISLILSNRYVFAQETPGQWVGDQYSVVLITDMQPSRVLIDEKNAIHKTIPHVSKAGDNFPVDSRLLNNGIYSYWYNDVLYTLVHGANERDKDGSLFRRYTYAKWEDDEWHFLGSYKTGQNEVIKAIPCSDGRLIVISRNTDLTNNNKPDRSPFVRMSIDSEKNELRLGASINHGQDDLQKYMSNPACFSLAHSSNIVMTDEYATLINFQTGLYWVFSLEKASLRKAGNIFTKVTPEMIAKGGFQEAVFSVNPEKDGTVLIAAQEEDFFTTSPDSAGNVYMEMAEVRLRNPNMAQEEYTRELRARLKKQRDNSPFIAWYRLYPENGKVEKLSEPPEGGTHLREEEDGVRIGLSIRWRPMPDGSVKLGSLDSTLFEARQKEKEGSDEDEKNNKELTQAAKVTAQSSKANNDVKK